MMGRIAEAWLMMSGVGLAMGLLHLVIWLRRSRELHLLMFSISALAIAVSYTGINETIFFCTQTA